MAQVTFTNERWEYLIAELGLIRVLRSSGKTATTMEDANVSTEADASGVDMTINGWEAPHLSWVTVEKIETMAAAIQQLKSNGYEEGSGTDDNNNMSFSYDADEVTLTIS